MVNEFEKNLLSAILVSHKEYQEFLETASFHDGAKQYFNTRLYQNEPNTDYCINMNSTLRKLFCLDQQFRTHSTQCNIIFKLRGHLTSCDIEFNSRQR